MYTVTHKSSNDCYKRPFTDAEILYTGPDWKEALAVSVRRWFDLFDNVYERDEQWMSDLSELLPDGEPTAEELEAIHYFFEDNAETFWASEFIPDPYEEVTISAFDEEDNDSQSLSMVTEWIKNFKGEGE